MFRTVLLPIIRRFFTVHTAMVYVIQVCWQLASRIRTVPSWSCSQAVWHVPLLCVQWKTPDDEQRKCSKHVEFHSKNKFEKLVHLVGFIMRIYHDARSAERQSIYNRIRSPVSLDWGRPYAEPADEPILCMRRQGQVICFVSSANQLSVSPH